MNDDLETVFPLPAWFVLVAFILFGCPTSVSAGPRYQAHSQEQGLTITLHDDQCKFPNQVTNLPYKATWHQKGEVMEGCWGRNQFPVVTFYFPQDKTVFAVPLQAFEEIKGTGT